MRKINRVRAVMGEECWMILQIRNFLVTQHESPTQQTLTHSLIYLNNLLSNSSQLNINNTI